MKNPIFVSIRPKDLATIININSLSEGGVRKINQGVCTSTVTKEGMISTVIASPRNLTKLVNSTRCGKAGTRALDAYSSTVFVDQKPLWFTHRKPAHDFTLIVNVRETCESKFPAGIWDPNRDECIGRGMGRCKTIRYEPTS